MPEYKIRIKKAFCIVMRKTSVLKERKFENVFHQHFDRPTIVYCIVDTVSAVLAGITLLVSEAAC